MSLGFRFSVSRLLPLLPLLALPLLALAVPDARAQTTLLSNLDLSTPSDARTTLIGPGSGTQNGVSGANYQKAFAFTTGSTDYSLSSVQAYLALASGQSGTSVLSFTLYSPSAGNQNIPGTLIGSLGTQNVTNANTTATVYTFAPSSAITLSNATRYVLLLDYVSGSTGTWLFPSTNDAPTARDSSGYSSVVYGFSNNDGASYNTSATNSSIAVNGTAIGGAVSAPEPGTIALVLTAGVPVVGIIRRRRIAKK